MSGRESRQQAEAFDRWLTTPPDEQEVLVESHAIDCYDDNCHGECLED